MQNSDNKERDFWATSAQSLLTDISPILIILSFGASLLAFGILKYNYLADLFSVKLPSIGLLVAGMVAVVSELFRFAFGLTGVRDLVNGNKANGILGIGASLLLSVYDHFEASRMATHWDNPELWYALVFLVWGGMVAEIRLMMTMSEVKVVGNEQNRQQGQEKQSQKNGMPSYQYSD